jgi:hypothetical protein
VEVDCSLAYHDKLCRTHTKSSAYSTFRSFERGAPDLPDYGHNNKDDVDSEHDDVRSTMGNVFSLRSFLAKRVSGDYGPPFSRPSKCRLARQSEDSYSGKLVRARDYNTAKYYRKNVAIAFVTWWSDACSLCEDFWKAYRELAEKVDAQATSTGRKAQLMTLVDCGLDDCPQEGLRQVFVGTTMASSLCLR